MAKRKSALDRRIEQLEREAASVRNTISNLDYALKRVDKEGSSRLELMRERRPVSQPDAPVRSKDTVAKPVRRKIANYLSGGSFKAVKLSPQEIAVQRNKAIFMIIVLVIVIYVALKVFNIV
ncbi:MAG: hypothetical protein AB7T27_01740 [Kiritimatiellia bacterium]